jgi:hypothetical protein
MAAERLYSSSVELTELGTHAGMRLRGRVRRRALRLALGGAFAGGGLSLTLVRLRPLAVEVVDERGTRFVPIHAAPHPAEQTARRLAMVALGCALIIGIAGRLRRAGRGGEDAQR